MRISNLGKKKKKPENHSGDPGVQLGPSGCHPCLSPQTLSCNPRSKPTKGLLCILAILLSGSGIWTKQIGIWHEFATLLIALIHLGVPHLLGHFYSSILKKVKTKKFKCLIVGTMVHVGIQLSHSPCPHPSTSSTASCSVNPVKFYLSALLSSLTSSCLQGGYCGAGSSYDSVY